MAILLNIFLLLNGGISNRCSSNHTNAASIVGFNIFLPTFPIFTLFSSYTIVALTLINNIKVLVNFSENSRYVCFMQYSLPLVAILPPLLIALFTEDVSSIVGFVGSYSGTLIQYVFPTLLVYKSRIHVEQNCLKPLIQFRLNQMAALKKRNQTLSAPEMSLNVSTTNIIESETDLIDIKLINIKQIYYKLNPFASIFQNKFWIYFTFIWWILCIVLVTIDHIIHH